MSLKVNNASGTLPLTFDQSSDSENPKIFGFPDTILKNHNLTIQAKPLSEHQLKIISAKDFFSLDSLKDLSQSNFNSYSLAFIKILIDPNQFNAHQVPLGIILNDKLSDKQLCKHLNNLLVFLKLMIASEDEQTNIIKRQLSLLSATSIIKAAFWIEGQYDKKFFNHLWTSLELSNEIEIKTVNISSSTIKSKLKELWEMIQEEPRNLLVADEMLSSEPPKTLFDAQSVFSQQFTKYQTALQGADIVARAAPFPYGLIAAPAALLLPSLLGVARKVYFRWMCKAPVHLYPLNDSRKLNDTTSKNFIGREEVIQEILYAWNIKRTPLLVGDPGVGKTTIIEEVARRIEQGEIPEFVGKTCFFGSAAQLTSGSMMEQPPIQRVINTIQPYKENVVLALDEFHALMQAEDKTIPTLVRSVLDGSVKSLPYCLFATTTEDYKKYIEGDTSLARRIKVIEVKALEKDMMLTLLGHEARVISPFINVNETALKTIYELSNGRQTESRQLLHRIVIAAENKNRTHISFQERNLLKAKINLNTMLYLQPKLSLTKKNQYLDEISLSKKKLKIVEKECAKQENIRKKYEFIQEKIVASSDQCILNSKQIYGYVRDFQGSPQESEKKKLINLKFLNQYDDQLKTFLFLRYFDLPIQSEFIEAYAKFHELITEIGQDFVQNIFKIQNPDAIIRLKKKVTIKEKEELEEEHALKKEVEKESKEEDLSKP
jgi:ATP-dependent Clp protease ATP-binding subunit ClpA